MRRLTRDPRRCAHGLAALPLWLALAVPAAAGDGWIPLPGAPVIDGRHDDVFFVDPDRGWVVNGEGEIHHTADGGTSWVQQAIEPGIYFRAVGFANALRGFAGNLEGSPLLYTTTDGGQVWTPADNIPAPRPTGICGIWVVSESVVYACGRYDGPPRVIKTTDGGATWSASDVSPLASTLIDAYFVDENTGFLVGGIGSTFSNRRAVVLATTDGGATWQTRHTTTRTGEWCWKITFPTPSVGYVSIERFAGDAYFLQTTDGGQTWTERFFRNGYEEQGIGFATPELGWIGGWTGPTYETTDGGTTWQLAGFGENINRFRMLSPALGYAVGVTVYKYTLGTAGLLSVELGSGGALRLAQNYPNPFRGTTRIGYSLARESVVKLAIYDVAGRRVAALAGGPMPAGEHAVDWDGRDPSGKPVGSGVYWIRIEASGVTQSKSLLVAR